MIEILSAFLLALSLCADCFAVTSCSSVTLKSVDARKVLTIALSFGVIQTLLMLLGWLFGDIFVGVVEKVAHIIGFLMLLYVGGSMIIETVRGGSEARNLNGVRNVLIGGIATSLDAFAVGISLSMDRSPVSVVTLDLVAVFIVTVLSVVAGIGGGYKLGRKLGKPAEIAGGCVLILIGLNILLDFI